jgi:hypothetical protein
MTERVKSWLIANAIPLFLGVLILGESMLTLRQKEDASAHAIDVQQVKADVKNDVDALKARDEALYALQLDILCAVKPHDRRCYPNGR